MHVVRAKFNTPCAFPRHSLWANTLLFDCIAKCRATKGCSSVNFRSGKRRLVGECLILAPPNANITISTLSGWYLYGVSN